VAEAIEKNGPIFPWQSVLQNKWAGHSRKPVPESERAHRKSERRAEARRQSGSFDPTKGGPFSSHFRGPQVHGGQDGKHSWDKRNAARAAYPAVRQNFRGSVRAACPFRPIPGKRKNEAILRWRPGADLRDDVEGMEASGFPVWLYQAPAQNLPQIADFRRQDSRTGARCRQGAFSAIAWGKSRIHLTASNCTAPAKVPVGIFWRTLGVTATVLRGRRRNRQAAIPTRVSQLQKSRGSYSRIPCNVSGASEIVNPGWHGVTLYTEEHTR